MDMVYIAAVLQRGPPAPVMQPTLAGLRVVGAESVRVLGHPPAYAPAGTTRLDGWFEFGQHYLLVAAPCQQWDTPPVACLSSSFVIGLSCGRVYVVTAWGEPWPDRCPPVTCEVLEVTWYALPADVNMDNHVGPEDLLAFQKDPYDHNNDGAVNAADLVSVAQAMHVHCFLSAPGGPP